MALVDLRCKGCAAERNPCTNCGGTTTLDPSAQQEQDAFMNYLWFIGATRTYEYFAGWFQDGWIYQWPSFDEIKEYEPNAIAGTETVLDERCMGTIGQSNATYIAREVPVKVFDLNQQGDLSTKNDSLKTNYEYDTLSEQINEISDKVVKWVDDYVIFTVGGGPASLVFWLMGCGEPCYTCTYEDVICPGAGFEQLWQLKDAISLYWLEVYQDPDRGLFSHESFCGDYYGRIVRQPEPLVGWLKYSLLNLCNYCHCIQFCILRQCRDPWKMRIQIVNKMFLFNHANGIPYRLPGKLVSFADSCSKEFGIGRLDIKLDHFANEHVWVQGYANLYKGDISLSSSKLGGNKPEDTAIGLLGDLLKEALEEGGDPSSIVGTDFNEKGYKEATFVNSSGFNDEGGADIKILTIKPPESTGPLAINAEADGAVGTTYIVRNTAVKYLTSGHRIGMDQYPWIYVDIPEIVQPAFTTVKFSLDFGTLPDTIYEEKIPTQSNMNAVYIDDKEFFCRSATTAGFAKQIDGIVAGLGPGGTSAALEWAKGMRESPSQFGIDDQTGPWFPYLYAQRIRKKIVKAPYNLYFKSGEATFRECKLFETLTGLTPGRYYFPNPYGFCKNSIMNWYDFNVIGGIPFQDYLIDDKEGDVYKFFNYYLPAQFLGTYREVAPSDLEKRLFEAVRKLGLPWRNNFGAIRMEEYQTHYYEPDISVSLFRQANSLNDQQKGWLGVQINDFYRDLFLNGYTEYRPWQPTA